MSTIATEQHQQYANMSSLQWAIFNLAATTDQCNKFVEIYEANQTDETIEADDTSKTNKADKNKADASITICVPNHISQSAQKKNQKNDAPVNGPKTVHQIEVSVCQQLHQRQDWLYFEGQVQFSSSPSKPANRIIFWYPCHGMLCPSNGTGEIKVYYHTIKADVTN